MNAIDRLDTTFYSYYVVCSDHSLSLIMVTDLIVLPYRVRKKASTFSLRNFNKFRHSFVIFDTNHPDNSFY